MNVIRVLKPNPTRVFHDIQNGTSKDLESRVKDRIASLNQFWNISDLDCKFYLSLFIISLIIFRRKAIYLMVFKERIGRGSVISRYHSLKFWFTFSVRSRSSVALHNGSILVIKKRIYNHACISLSTESHRKTQQEAGGL